MPYRVLVADDEELERRALRRILGSAGVPGLEILDAANGREALDLVGEGRLDAAFLDIKMPGIDGIEAARRLRSSRPRLPIVFLTAHDSFEYARSALRLRVEDFLLKPASPEEVSAALRRALARAVDPGEGSVPGSAESLASYLADELRAELGEGRLEDARVARYLGLSGRGGGVRAVVALKAADRGARRSAGLSGIAELAERCLSSRERAALAGAGTELVLCAVMGEPSALGSEGAFESLLGILVERVRAELGEALVAGVAVAAAGEGSIPCAELAQAARRAAAVAGPRRPISLFSLASSPGTGEAGRGTGTSAAGRGTAYRALELLESRYADDLSLELVAEELGVSPSHLSRLLGRFAGMGFADCLARLRVEKAKRFLSSTGASVKEVSTMVGFRDPAYFARVFRRLEGRSPAEYRGGPGREGGRSA